MVMRVSVIISTYNSPKWLEKVIWGYRAQNYPQFELVVADDGSDQETASLVNRLRKKTGLTLHHVWHEDHGFRKCKILNKAIVESTGDYIILSDGDCIPRSDFVHTHFRLAEPNCLLSGGCVRLSGKLSEFIGIENILTHQCTDLRWLRANGLPLSKNILKLLPAAQIAWFMKWLTPTRATLNGHNASMWKADVFKVNGFDQRMEYGGLDRELGERLMNAGVRFKQVRHQAVCVHLDHGRPYVREEVLWHNRAIREYTRKSGSRWTPYGIDAGDRMRASLPDTLSRAA
jgi:glycosyltransferase involved in cell wall biosynthesis